jgi:protein-tyrosine-phosphatase
MLILRLIERVLHPLRRAASRRLITSTVKPGPILVLCHGNICRSPYAEHSLARALPGAAASVFPVDSAGFIGPDRGSPAEALAAAERAGIDLSEHRSKLFTKELVQDSSLIVVMSAQQKRGIRSRFPSTVPPVLVLGDLDPLPIEGRTIKDPWKCDASVFDQSYARIERCMRELASLLVAAEPQPQ